MSTAIDRIEPTLRPNEPVAGWQTWSDLLFVHWEVDSRVIQASLPEGLTVDEFDGRAFVGVVPFTMSNVRPWRWVPGFATFKFLECNVRTYVTHNGRPGVYFYSLDAASRLAVWAARTFWGLPYFNAKMSQERHADSGDIHYESHRHGNQATLTTRYRITDELGPSAPGSLEHFLLERYLLFVERGGKIQCGQVHHTPYPAFRADVSHCEQTLTAAAGLGNLQNSPPLQHYSPGVDVEIFPLRAVD